MDNKYIYDMVMGKLCDICVKLNDIQKDIKCIKGQTESNGGHLPKLTDKVFNRPDCPKWAKYAAVDEDGETTFFDKMPYPATKTCGCFLRDCQYATIPSKFDASDWQNSLIERPAQFSREIGHTDIGISVKGEYYD